MSLKCSMSLGQLTTKVTYPECPLNLYPVRTKFLSSPFFSGLIDVTRQYTSSVGVNDTLWRRASLPFYGLQGITTLTEEPLPLRGDFPGPILGCRGAREPKRYLGPDFVGRRVVGDGRVTDKSSLGGLGPRLPCPVRLGPFHSSPSTLPREKRPVFGNEYLPDDLPYQHLVRTTISVQSGRNKQNGRLL